MIPLRFPMTRLWTQEPDTFAPRGKTPIDTIVVHYTATAGLARVSSATRGSVLAQRARAKGYLWPEHLGLVLGRFNRGFNCSDALALCMIAGTNDRRASWHYCVASKPEDDGCEDCEIVEYVPTAVQAHHVGALGLRTNKRSIGIECVYPGSVSHRKSQAEAIAFYRPTGWTGAIEKLPGPDGVKRWYVEPDQIQVDTLTSLVSSLCRQYATITAICSHYLFAPSKRTDPDPPYDLVKLREVVGEAVGRPMAARPPRKADGSPL